VVARSALNGFLARFRAEESGATAIEYAVLIVCIGTVLVAALSVLQTSIYGLLNSLASNVLATIS